MKSVKSKVEGLEVVRRTKKAKKYSFISNRDHLMYAIVKSAPHTYYLPPLTEDSTFFVDAMALAVNKNFSYKQQFDYL